MGCIPQYGILGPRKSHKEVYIEMIEMMHDQMIVHFENFNQQISYQSIKSVLISKGLIKKLSDNLLSHKAKISDCLHYCSKRLESIDVKDYHIYTGLVIITQVLVRLDNQYNLDRQKHLRNSKQPPRQKAITLSTQVLQILNNYQQPLMNLHNQPKIQRQYLKFILQIINKQKIVYQIILNSIIIYCKNKKQKFNCKVQIHRLLDYIVQNLYMNHQMQMSCIAYLYLLNKLKQGSTKDDLICQKALYHFIILWSKTTKNNTSNKCLQYYESIIKIFFQRGLSNWDYRFLYRSIFSIYDVYDFDQSNVIQIQELFFRIIQDNDINNQIKKGYLQYLFQYLSCNQVQENQNLFSQEYKINRYQNIYKKQTKINGLKSIRRLQEKQYININSYAQLCKFMLVGVYMNNFYIFKDIDGLIIQQFSQLCELLNKKSNINILDILIEELMTSNPSLRTNLFKMIKQILKQAYLFEEQLPEIQHFFMPLDQDFLEQQKAQYINIMLLVFKSINFDLCTIEDYQSSPLINNISLFLYNIYQNFKINAQIDNISISEFLIQNQQSKQINYKTFIGEFLSSMWQKKMYNILIAYLQNIKQDIISIIHHASHRQQTIELCFNLYQKAIALFGLSLQELQEVNVDQSNKDTADIDDGTKQIIQKLNILSQIKNKYITNKQDFVRMTENMGMYFNRLKFKSQLKYRQPQMLAHRSFITNLSHTNRSKSLLQCQSSFKLIFNQLHDQ